MSPPTPIGDSDHAIVVLILMYQQ